MRKTTCAICIFLPLLPAMTAFAQAQPAVEIGAEERVRSENWNNVFDYSGSANDEREQVRFRTRLWTKIPLGAHIEFNAGLNGETNLKLGLRGNRLDEVAFETANVVIRNIGLRGLSLRVGRQDLMKGDGLVLFEATPWDGSRTLYTNAADLSYTFRKSTIEAIGILNPRTDRFLPRIHDQKKPLIDWDEQALGLYYTDNNLRDTTIEAYYFHKKEINDPRPITNPQYQPNRRVETLGARAKRKFNAQWSATVETAAQWGVQHPTTPIRAWAALGSVTRSFAGRWKPYATTALYALSGDDPARPGRISGWDPIFARWPKFGDLELYSQMPEKAVGYMTNQKRLQLEAGFVPLKGTTWKFYYYHVGAFHPFPGKPTMFGSGTTRGNNFQTRLDFQINSALKGHVDYETLLPGSFYAGSGRAYFLRFEMIAQVKTLLHGSGPR